MKLHVERLTGRKHLEDMSTDGKILLILILGNGVKVGTGFI
jgi:hypothetical protein